MLLRSYDDSRAFLVDTVMCKAGCAGDADALRAAVRTRKADFAGDDAPRAVVHTRKTDSAGGDSFRALVGGGPRKAGLRGGDACRGE